MSLPEAAPAQPPKRKLRLYHLLPLGFFVALALIFLTQLRSGVDPSEIPSALVGKPAPSFTLPPLDGMNVPGLSQADLIGHVTLVNVFASWCVPCREEHPVLSALAADPRIRVVGIDYKDDPGNARTFLTGLGNPYVAIGTDTRGRTAIDWGVYGVPETFLVDASGVIRHKIIGPLSDAVVANDLKPAIDKVLAPPG